MFMRYLNGRIGHVNQDSQWQIPDDSGEDDMDIDSDDKEQPHARINHAMGVSNRTGGESHMNVHHKGEEGDQGDSDAASSSGSDSDSDTDLSNSNDSDADESSGSEESEIHSEDGEDDDDDGYGSF
jgi:hypothetical protein